MAIAVAMYFLVIAPIIKVSLVSMILVTVGVSLLLENLALVKWGGYGLGIPSFPGDRTLHFWKLTFEVQSIWVIVIAHPALHWGSGRSPIARASASR